MCLYCSHYGKFASTQYRASNFRLAPRVLELVLIGVKWEGKCQFRVKAVRRVAVKCQCTESPLSSVSSLSNSLWEVCNDTKSSISPSSVKNEIRTSEVYGSTSKVLLSIDIRTPYRARLRCAVQCGKFAVEQYRHTCISHDMCSNLTECASKWENKRQFCVSALRRITVNHRYTDALLGVIRCSVTVRSL